MHQGEFVAVVGLNGAGKTTLFNAVSGLAPYAGDIRREGRSLRGRDGGDDRARGNRPVAGRARTLRRDDGARESRTWAGTGSDDSVRTERQEWLFDLFPVLKERQSQTAATLSGGEQQMLTIARALMMKPDLLILDEPTLGLAPVIMEQISKALARLRQTTEMTVLLGEQNVTFALPHADRVYVLEHGRIVWEGDPSRFASGSRGAISRTASLSSPRARSAAASRPEARSRHSASVNAISSWRPRRRSSRTMATPLPAMRAMPASARAFGSAPKTKTPDSTPQSAKL